MSKLVCPVCGGRLLYDRIDDGHIKAEIISNSEVVTLENESDGSTRVYCSQDGSHKIPDALWAEVETIASNFYD